MYLRRGVITASILTTSLIGGRAQPSMDVCRPHMHTEEAICSKGQMRDGTLHLTVYLHPSASDQHKEAFRGAIRMWNAHSGITRIHFEETSIRTADLRFQLNREQSRNLHNRACAAYEGAASYVWYSEPLMRNTIQKKELAVRIYAHEIGHALNLNHLPEIRHGENRTKKLMMHSEREELPCEDLAADVIANVSQEDARSAQKCAYGARDTSQCIEERARKSIPR